ncbi:Gfo/Idh/MocA family oxidoreductase [Peribacillus psychrosaccharolyticus]|uniref:Gfo/Idh/MocA family oxidoreductase n=1 Tax=Peribacillus psychrosaccharolyticus TaxID=1407 RepID=A0A974RZQ1_PERPY|nr:Gfo/Idh/MocA family oxidoreductase [Peribacillus psychrosaccharolyticus]MEC2056977.1 Gfo/Idh/MocA family oxidoreductase [Peribacillus psychrosaccharolyticus]MED3744899.1 Gfo/Idh/MocA family oxidoreductase [Peribacillus psychrosaccharolyticus]QQS98479.1 Gfo/Idh/MocA family oxidoreductase [Peribacillus psychrosaccharolyticus]
MHKLKVGVIGCGSIARYRHLAEYQAHENVEIIAVCDVVQERALEMAEKFGAAAYTDYQELLKNDEVEAVSICTPNALHAPMSITALRSGKHVLCEKPMATSLVEAEAMIEAAKVNKKKLMIAHNQRFVPSHDKAHELIQSGDLGKIYSFKTSFGHGGPEGWSIDGADSWFFDKKQAFIGAMGDLGVHKTDLMRFLLNEEFTEVAAFIETNAKQNTDIDDNAVFILKTENGIIGTLAASWSYGAKEDNSTIIYGEKGIMRLEDDPDHSLIIHYTNGQTVKENLGGIQTNEEGGQEDSGVITRFVTSILSDTVPPVNGDEGMKSLKVILGALDSNKTKKIITL